MLVRNVVCYSRLKFVKYFDQADNLGVKHLANRIRQMCVENLANGIINPLESICVTLARGHGPP